MATDDSTRNPTDWTRSAIETIADARNMDDADAIEAIAGRLRDAYRAGQIAEITGRIGTETGLIATPSAPTMLITPTELLSLAEDKDVEAFAHSEPALVREVEAAAAAMRFMAAKLGARSEVAPPVSPVTLRRQVVVLVGDEVLPWSRDVATPLMAEIIKAVG